MKEALERIEALENTLRLATETIEIQQNVLKKLSTLAGNTAQAVQKLQQNFQVHEGPAFALHRAVLSGESATIFPLLQSASSSINLADRNGNTPLHLAAQNGYHEIAALLLSAGASTTITNKQGNTPLHLAVLANSLQTAEIVKWGAVHILNANGETALRIAQQKNNSCLMASMPETRPLSNAERVIIHRQTHPAQSLIG